MLSLGLVLFVISSAVGGYVGVTTVPINELPRPVDNGALVSGYIIDGPLELIDEGDLNIYIKTLQDSTRDLANSPQASSQALAVSQIINILGELATGIPGDVCAAANLIDVYAAAVSSGNYNKVRAAIRLYLNTVLEKIDLIAQLNANNNKLKFISGTRGSCALGGRSYNFEGGWSTILDNANPAQLQILNEVYCSSRRLYNAWNVRSNNVGALVTAASLRPVANIVRVALTPLAKFLRAVAAGANASAQAAAAKQALLQAAESTIY